MSQARPRTRRLRRPLLLLGLVAFLAGGAAWLFWPTDPIGPRAFHRIQLGMTEAEVEAAIGMPAGRYAAERYPGMYEFRIYSARAIAEKERPEGVAPGHTSRHWYGEDYWIRATFDATGELVRVHLIEVPPEPFRPSAWERLRSRLGI